MTRYPLAVVCALGLLAGAAAGLVLDYTHQRPADVQGVAEQGAGAGRQAGAEAEAGAGRVDGGAHAEDREAPGAVTPTGPRAGSITDDAEDAGGRSGGRFGRGTGVPAEHDRRAVSGAGGRTQVVGKPFNATRASRGDVRVSGGGRSAGGRGVAGHALHGVKKTGEGVKRTGAAIGRTFGRIGGVFHD